MCWSQAAGVLVAAQRLAHLGAGGLIKVEIAFFSYSRDKGMEEEGGFEGMETALASITESTLNGPYSMAQVTPNPRVTG